MTHRRNIGRYKKISDRALLGPLTGPHIEPHRAKNGRLLTWGSYRLHLGVMKRQGLHRATKGPLRDYIGLHRAIESKQYMGRFQHFWGLDEGSEYLDLKFGFCEQIAHIVNLQVENSRSR